mgnify:CR=1 FL=1
MDAALNQLTADRGFANLSLSNRTWVPAMVPWRATEQGEVSPVASSFDVEFFVDDFVIDDLQFLPPELVIQTPPILITLFGKPVKLAYGDEIRLPVPEAWQAYVDVERAPLVVNLPQLDMDALLKRPGVADRPADYWDSALEIDLRNPQLPYIEEFLSAGTVTLGGQDWDVGVNVGLGWQDQTLLDMLFGDAPDFDLSFTQTGLDLQVPGFDLGGIALAGPSLSLDFVLPDGRTFRAQAPKPPYSRTLLNPDGRAAQYERPKCRNILKGRL